MARVKLSALVDDISGKLGSTVFANTAGGLAARAHVIPANPKTARQVAARAAISDAGAAWEALTNEQRSDWLTYAADNPVTGRLGQTIYLSAFNHFCRAYTLASLAGVTLPTSGPSTPGLPADSGATSVTQAAASTAMTMIFGTGANWWKSTNGTAVIAMVHAPQSATRQTIQTPARAVLVAKGNAGSPPSSPASFVNPWGSVASGLVVYVRLKTLGADGRISAEETFRVTAA